MSHQAGVTIFIIGSELLVGEKRDENGPYIMEMLRRSGIGVAQFSILPDRADIIEREVKARVSADDCITILCGGLGPTEDDLTKQAVARALDRHMIRDDSRVREMVRLLGTRNHRTTSADLRQAEMIDGAGLIPNTVGLAPGLRLEEKGVRVYLLPGPPHEMRAMFEGYVLPEIEEYGNHLKHGRLMLRTAGLREAELASVIEPVFRRYPTLTYAVLPSFRTIDIVVSYGAHNHGEAHQAVETVRNRIPSDVYAEDGRSLAAVVGELLMARNEWFAVAESCTGGLLGKMVTDVPGSSRYFRGGIIAYSDEIKKGLLGVAAETLRSTGAVSAAVATEMAAGVRDITSADWGVAVTGVAGPGGGSPEKPVGTVFIGLSAPDGSSYVRQHIMGGDRCVVRAAGSNCALDMLRRYVSGGVGDV